MGVVASREHGGGIMGTSHREELSHGENGRCCVTRTEIIQKRFGRQNPSFIKKKTQRHLFF